MSSWLGAPGEKSFLFLWEDGERAFYRIEDAENQSTLLAIRPAAEHPTPASLDRLSHEYGLRDELESAWAARPLDLVRQGGQTLLLLEDRGGEPLSRLLGEPMAVERFLRIAIEIVSALGKVHQRGLVHKDLKPANILLNRANGEVRLTGFGIASRLPRERQALEPPETIAGTLAYMAPEQTGRMNRSVDSRSDLYALGVTLYQMLTGSLPFTASNPMEWVHCHVARRPVPPSEQSESVPSPVSRLVMKLLAKTAEERYQTAAGVEHDLRRCLADWQTGARIDDFPLGEHDTPDRLLIPEKLYGRERETQALLGAFDRVVKSGASELVLVSGYSGIGKSSVVNELQKALVPSRGLFASGKFDQYKRNIPYATVAQGLKSLVSQLLGKGETEMAQWRAALEEALGPNGQLMITLVPELALIIGEQPPAPDLSPQDRQARFQLVFRRFLGVFARPEHPLVLFLDDLQWLDSATLDLLEHLLAHPDVRHLLLVGAYRDNEVGPAHPLARTLMHLRSAGGRVREIVLAPLRPEDVARLLADTVHMEPEYVRPLADLVFAKTGGNPFFTIQFLLALAEQTLLTFDPGREAWAWDLARIRVKGFTDNVADLMAAKLSRLPTATRKALGLLACIGNVVRANMLAAVHEDAAEATHAALWVAVHAGYVLFSDNAYTFLHDRIREAAYALIPERARAMEHLRIGRALAATPLKDLDGNIFDVVNQFDHAAKLISTQQERERVAQLNLIAGQRAKAATAYDTALQYFTSGRALLGETGREHCYRTAFDLELNCAECEYLVGKFAAAEERLTALSNRAQSAVDAAAVTCVRINLYTTLSQSASAIEVGLAYLRRVGGEWSPHPTEQDVRQAYQRLRQQLTACSSEALLDLPLMSDPTQCATMDVLTVLTSPALFTDLNLFRLVVSQMATLSLAHGNCNGSCLAYAWLGGVLGTYFGEYEAGFRLGRLGLDLVEKYGLDRFKARVYLVFAVHVAHWTQPLETSLAFLRRAFNAALEAGDLSYAAYSCIDVITNRLATGDSLDEVEREAEHGLEFARNLRFPQVSDTIDGQIRFLRTLRGLTPEINSFNDAEFDEHSFEQHLESDPQLAIAASFYWIRKLQARVLANDAAAAMAAVSKVAPLLWTIPTQFEWAEYHFYGALAWAAHCDITSVEQHPQHLQALAVHHRQLAVWAEHCPATFANRAALVGAEIARLEGRDLDAMRLYEEAIRLAREQGFVHNEALAHEHAARFCTARGYPTMAEAYLRNARHCYQCWGAEGKVRQLDQRYAQLREKAPASAPTSTIRAPLEHLDLATVLKVSQAVSGEIVLDNLIDTLMRTAIEQAGAERGVLIVQGEGEAEPRLAAQATTSRERVIVQLCDQPLATGALPRAVLHYVMRTREYVMLDDAAAQPPFAADPYIQERQARSILCLPLLAQAKLTGALYLENSLAQSVFAPARVAVLKLLASQAAIALENARLYRDLATREARIRRLVDANIVGICIWDLEGRILEANDAFLRIVGYDREDLVSGRIRWTTDLTPPEWRDSDARAVEQLKLTGTSQPFEKEYLRKDGSRVPVLIGPATFEEQGNQGVAFVLDLSERKRAEADLREAQMALAHANRAATMGQLTASIAHEVKQPISAAAANAAAALRWLSARPMNLDEATQALERIVNDVMRAGDIIGRIRHLIEKAPPRKDRVDINEAVREVIELTRGEAAKHGISMQAALGERLPTVSGDRVQFQQVMLNLIVNAIEAMSATSEGPRALLVRTTADSGQGVSIAVSDSGPGLPAEGIERVFEPFYTTKASGLGMGLSICRSIVDAHGGRLSAKPNVPRGAVFQFTLPAHADDPS